MLFTERTLAIANSLSNEQCGLLFRRLLEYTAGNDNPTDDQMVEFSFKVLKVDLDDSAEKFKALCEKRRIAGQKGGLAKQANLANASNCKQNIASVAISNSNSNSNRTSTNVEDNSSNEEYNSLARVKLSSTDNAVDLNGIVNYWNTQLDNHKGIMSEVKTISGKRKNSVLARVKEYGKEAIKTVIDKATASQFLNGKNDRGWIASFDWVFQHPNNFIKVLEGNYDEKIIRNNADANQYQSASERVDAILGLLNKDEQQ